MSLCRNDSYLPGQAADWGDYLLFILTAEGRNFEVRIVPYVVNRDRSRLITRWECTQGELDPSVNSYLSAIRTYAYAALALAEIRRLESSREPCRARHAQFFLERALSALTTRAGTTASERSASADLQRYLEEKRRWLEPQIEMAAKTADGCGMPPESSRLSDRLPGSS
jgi:hypothetical protein